MDELLAFSQSTGVYAFMHSTWGWPFVESLHFVGLCLLLGAVGVFDLRLLGIGRGISMRGLHPLVPYGIAGFTLSLVTGLLFFMSAPDQYAFNPAFQTKMGFMLIAGCNMFLFNSLALRVVAPIDSTPPRGATFFAAISLFCWLVVIICGRLITYYRPPYHWCFWC